MNIVLDSNILFSALIKDSITRKIILMYDGYFLFPSYIFEELEKHKQELLQKSSMKSDEFNALLTMLLQKVMIVPSEVIIPFKKEAYEIVKKIDPNDVTFIACALAYPDSILWTDDKQLKQQSKVPVITTSEFIEFYY